MLAAQGPVWQQQQGKLADHDVLRASSWPNMANVLPMLAQQTPRATSQWGRQLIHHGDDPTYKADEPHWGIGGLLSPFCRSAKEMVAKFTGATRQEMPVFGTLWLTLHNKCP